MTNTALSAGQQRIALGYEIVCVHADNEMMQ